MLDRPLGGADREAGIPRTPQIASPARDPSAKFFSQVPLFASPSYRTGKLTRVTSAHSLVFNPRTAQRTQTLLPKL